MKAFSVVALLIAACAAACPADTARPSPRYARGFPPTQSETDRSLVWASFARRGENSARRLSDGDVIKVSVTHTPGLSPAQRLVSWAVPEPVGAGRDDIPRDRVEIVLVAGAGVTWWKGITAFGNATPRPPGGAGENWVRLAHIDTQSDDPGPKRMLLSAVELRGRLKLSFEKVKAFGARAPVYSFDVPNAGKIGGHRITFTWEKDG